MRINPLVPIFPVSKGNIQRAYPLDLSLIHIWARRLHDINMSALFLLLNLIPGIGSLILLVFACMDSQPGSNQYGPCLLYTSRCV